MFFPFFRAGQKFIEIKIFGIFKLFWDHFWLHGPSDIEKAYSISVVNGAIGGKISGAGGGGFLNIVAKPEYHKQIISALSIEGLKRCQFSIDSYGTQVTKFD